MNVAALTSSNPIAETALPIDRRGSYLAAHASPAFESILTQHTDADRKAEARQAASQLVASTFIVPILGKMRETSWAEGPFAPGAAEKRFGPLLDQHLADRIIEASNFDIVDVIAERYASFGRSAENTATQARFERTG